MRSVLLIFKSKTLKFVWNLYLYTVNRAELCTSHTVVDLNSIHLKLIIKKKRLTTADQSASSCLENSCSFPTLTSWGYRRGKADVNSLSATDCFNTVGSFQQRDVCCANGAYHNGKPVLFEGSQHLHNSLKFSSPLQDLLAWGARLLCLMQAGHHPFPHGMASEFLTCQCVRNSGMKEIPLVLGLILVCSGYWATSIF